MDTLLRNVILEMSLTCEHLLKVRLLSYFNENSGDDGYEIVKRFLDSPNNYKKPQILNLYKQNKKRISIYQRNLLDKYYGDFAIWNFVEILTFSEFLDFCDFYSKNSDFRLPAFTTETRILRNVSAHNCCLLHILKETPQGFTPNKKLQTKIKQLQIFGKNNKLEAIKNPLVHDLTALMFLFVEICPKTEMFEKMRDKILLFISRARKHEDYFIKNNIIKDKSIFVFKVFSKVMQYDVDINQHNSLYNLSFEELK